MALYRVSSRVPRHVRAFAVVSGSLSHNALAPYQVFDRNVKRLQKDRAAARDGGERSRTVDYIRNEIADRMMERLLVRLFFHEQPLLHSLTQLGKDIKRNFDTILDLGSGPGHFSKLLEPPKARKVVMLDSSRKHHLADFQCPSTSQNTSGKTLHRDPDSEFEGLYKAIQVEVPSSLNRVPSGNRASPCGRRASP